MNARIEHAGAESTLSEQQAIANPLGSLVCGPVAAAPKPDHGWGELMAAAQRGDVTAYERLLEETRIWLRRYYSHRLPSSMVEDAAQDALIAVHQKKHTYDPVRPFGPWLAAIARYKWIDRLRKLKSSPSIEMRDELSVADPADSVANSVVLDRLLRTLKNCESNVIRLVKIYGLSVEEASAWTGQSASLVKVNVFRGMERLRALARTDSHAEG